MSCNIRWGLEAQAGMEGKFGCWHTGRGVGKALERAWGAGTGLLVLARITCSTLSIHFPFWTCRAPSEVGGVWT